MPASRSEKPLAFGVLSVRCRVGRWKSASAMMTCLPTSPKTRPRFTTTVDLPSPGSALAIMMRRMGMSRPSSWISTRSRRKASTKRKYSSWLTSSGWPPPIMNIDRRDRTRGMLVSTGSPVRLRTSSSVSTGRLKYSKVAGTPRPMTSARASATPKKRSRFWLVAGRGTLGGIDDLHDLHLALLADTRGRELLGEHGVQAAVRLHLGGRAWCTRARHATARRGSSAGCRSARGGLPPGRSATGWRSRARPWSPQRPSDRRRARCCRRWGRAWSP